MNIGLIIHYIYFIVQITVLVILPAIYDGRLRRRVGLVYIAFGGVTEWKDRAFAN